MTQGCTLPPFTTDARPESPISLQAGSKVQDVIGHALEAHYVELVREPIPDRLLQLLAALEAGELHHE